MIWHVRKALAYGIVGIGALCMLVPFTYMVSSSLKTMLQAVRVPPVWIPRPIVWRNYVDIWQQVPLGRVLLNSMKISTLVTLGQLF